jgi:hypothetical protein
LDKEEKGLTREAEEFALHKKDKITNGPGKITDGFFSDDISA